MPPPPRANSVYYKVPKRSQRRGTLHKAASRSRLPAGRAAGRVSKWLGKRSRVPRKAAGEAAGCKRKRLRTRLRAFTTEVRAAGRVALKGRRISRPVAASHWSMSRLTSRLNKSRSNQSRLISRRRAGTTSAFSPVRRWPSFVVGGLNGARRLVPKGRKANKEKRRPGSVG